MNDYKLTARESRQVIRAANNANIALVVFSPIDVCVFEFVNRDEFVRLCCRERPTISGYITSGKDRERTYTVFELDYEPWEFITPGMYSPMAPGIRPNYDN